MYVFSQNRCTSQLCWWTCISIRCWCCQRFRGCQLLMYLQMYGSPSSDSRLRTQAGHEHRFLQEKWGYSHVQAGMGKSGGSGAGSCEAQSPLCPDSPTMCSLCPPACGVQLGHGWCWGEAGACRPLGAWRCSARGQWCHGATEVLEAPLENSSCPLVPPHTTEL